MAEKLGCCNFFEVSAKTNSNVFEALYEIVLKTSSKNREIREIPQNSQSGRDCILL